MELENCTTCLRPPPEEGTVSTTQWKSVCRCDYTYSPNHKYSIDLCLNCRRKIFAQADTVGSSLVDLCTCASPNSKTVPSYMKQGKESGIPNLDLKSLGVDENSFPQERFQPIGFLGKGKKATTILCIDKQQGRKVTLKLLHNLSEEHRAKFEEEVRKLKQLSHPKIAKVLDSGVCSPFTPYIVTEHKEGFNLVQYLNIYGCPTHDVAVEILVGICEALVYANKQGLQNRSIKPTNVIFLDDMNSDPSICMTDFNLGLIELKDDALDLSDFHYMSSDLARGLEYDERSQMYSIACVGYTLMTGKTPFLVNSSSDIRKKHCLELPKRISDLNFDNKRPKDLEEIMERCLEKNPRDRFETLEKLLERLEVFPRRKKMQLKAIEDAKNRQKLVKIAAIVAAIIAVCAIAFFAISAK